MGVKNFLGNLFNRDGNSNEQDLSHSENEKVSISIHSFFKAILGDSFKVYTFSFQRSAHLGRDLDFLCYTKINQIKDIPESAKSQVFHARCLLEMAVLFQSSSALDQVPFYLKVFVSPNGVILCLEQSYLPEKILGALKDLPVKTFILTESLFLGLGFSSESWSQWESEARVMLLKASREQVPPLSKRDLMGELLDSESTTALADAAFVKAFQKAEARATTGVKGGDAPSQEENIRLQSKPSEKESEQRLAADQAEKLEAIKVSGQAEDVDDSETVVEGGESESSDDEDIVVLGDDQTDDSLVKTRIRSSKQKKSQGLLKKIKAKVLKKSSQKPWAQSSEEEALETSQVEDEFEVDDETEEEIEEDDTTVVSGAPDQKPEEGIRKVFRKKKIKKPKIGLKLKQSLSEKSEIEETSSEEEILEEQEEESDLEENHVVSSSNISNESEVVTKISGSKTKSLNGMIQNEMTQAQVTADAEPLSLVHEQEQVEDDIASFLKGSSEGETKFQSLERYRQKRQTKEKNASAGSEETASSEGPLLSQQFEKTILGSEQAFDQSFELVKSTVMSSNLAPELKDKVYQLFEALTKGRAQLNMQMKSIHGEIKRKEHEFELELKSMVSDLMRAEAGLRAKDLSLERARQLLGVASSKIDSLRRLNENRPVGSDKNDEMAQRIIATARSQVEKASRRIEELQRKLSSEMSHKNFIVSERNQLERKVEDAQKKLNNLEGLKNTVADMEKVKKERDIFLRQVEELKRQNRQLQDKITQYQDEIRVTANARSARDAQGSNGAQGGSLEGSDKRQYEKLQLQFQKVKDEQSKALKKIEELRQSEAKLKLELGKAQAETKAALLKAKRNPGDSGSGSPPNSKAS